MHQSRSELEVDLDPQPSQLLTCVFFAAIALEDLILSDEARPDIVSSLENLDGNSGATKMDSGGQPGWTGASNDHRPQGRRSLESVDSQVMLRTLCSAMVPIRIASP